MNFSLNSSKAVVKPKQGLSIFGVKQTVATEKKQFISSIEDINKPIEIPQVKLVISFKGDTWSVSDQIKQAKEKKQEQSQSVTEIESQKESQPESKQTQSKELSVEELARQAILKSVNPDAVQKEDHDSKLVIPVENALIGEGKEEVSQIFQTIKENQEKSNTKEQVLEEIESKPDAPDPNSRSYTDMPVEDFGAALLRGMGYKDDGFIGRKPQKIEPVQLKPIPFRSGLGAQVIDEKELKNSNILRDGADIGITHGQYTGFMGSIISIKMMRINGDITININDLNKMITVHKSNVILLNNQAKIKNFFQEYISYGNNREFLKRLEEQSNTSVHSDNSLNTKTKEQSPSPSPSSSSSLRKSHHSQREQSVSKGHSHSKSKNIEKEDKYNDYSHNRRTRSRSQDHHHHHHNTNNKSNNSNRYEHQSEHHNHNHNTHESHRHH
ncbi:hypothetical protein WA158_003406 [Blastocystis sp. Blastoise]